MSIDHLGQYGGFYSQYRLPQIQSVSVEEVRKQDEEIEKQQQQQVVPSEVASVTQNRAPRTANLEDISLTFNSNETFDYIGRDASLDNLDMMSAISDMQKDKVLEQYQYFVGPKEISGQMITVSPDGMVIQK